MPRMTFYFLQLLAYCMLIGLSNAINGPNIRSSSANEYLYVVSLSQRAPNETRGEASSKPKFENRHFCTGTLISRRNVLTIANCLLQRQPSNVEIIAGATNLRNGLKYYPKSWLTYDQWKHGRVHEHPLHDIAVIKLEGAGIRQINIMPVDVSYVATESLYNKKVRLAGWSESEFGNKLSSLRSGSLIVIPNEECVEKNSKLLNRPFKLPSNYFCSLAEPWALSSPGDAGAPLLNKTRELVGLNVGVCPHLEGPQYTPEFLHKNQMNCHIRLPLYEEFIEDVKK